MKYYLRNIVYSLTVVLISTSHSIAQLKIPNFPDSLFPTYYWQRVTHFKTLPQAKNEIIFLGNSITDGAEWSELFADIHVKNRGISGDITAGVINRLSEVTDRKPKKIFLLIGVNDLSKNISADSALKNIFFIAEYVRQQSPATKLFVQSILPVNNFFGKFNTHTNKGALILTINKELFNNAALHHYTFIDLFPYFSDADGKLSKQFTNDGLHLLGDGYMLWKHIIYPYVYDLQQMPSLIPMPILLKWRDGLFPIYKCKNIVAKKSDGLLKEAELLQSIFSEFGYSVIVSEKLANDEPFIQFELDNKKITSDNKEAYQLEITSNKILLTAVTAHGIFNGIQTLRQLMRDGVMIDNCIISDSPAFSWRGYMIDVGRNYMTVDLLKQQIEMLSRYKFNVFHFHSTEDIAWRFEIKQYPQLTAPETMLRNKGLYYTQNEIKDLIQFCKNRYITFVPEIDIPGHSAAFKRAMKTDMQSDSGIVYLKNILKEICTTYDIDYLHIGADEVKITNSNFIPEMTNYIEGFGKKVIGWQPGGNFTDNTLRQLWMDDNAHTSANTNIKFIDSRHLYLNHIDPLEAVTTIFNRKIGDKNKGDNSLLGGEICMWNDRAAATGEDILKMNPVYPGMLAFSERSWRGGGQSGWIANISDGDIKGVKEFEKRLVDQKKIFFNDLPFTYVKQSDIVWNLFGPFNNDGDLSKKFEPEIEQKKLNLLKRYKQVIGGTIVLRHWWAPLIKGAIDSAKENTTWYAATKIWSDEAGEKLFWVGFNNISRSPATDSPPAYEWNNKGDAVWVNGNLIDPPNWKRAGQKGNSEIPLIDEGYEYREPTKIFLQQGWNDILIKAPIGSFKGKDWQNPVKWMFTFVEVN